jgi:hypothetical protein
VGDVGTGKTHMAEALCALACERALPARSFAAPSPVMRRDEGRPDRGLAQIGGAELLVIGELGFLPPDADGARLLSQVVSGACETQPVVLATSLEFSRWGSGVRRRPDGGGSHRPRRASRQAPAVQGRIVPCEACAHEVREAPGKAAQHALAGCS